MQKQQMLQAVDDMIAIAEGRNETMAWIQGSGHQPIHKGERTIHGMCLGAMLDKVAFEQRVTRDVSFSWESADGQIPQSPLAEAIGKVIVEQYPDRLGFGPEVQTYIALKGERFAIVPFNDHPDTTPADVVRVLEKARLVLEEAA